ncbi:ATP-dependent sacrificial sulfur transferase LarE [Selenomonas sp. AE3005]|uniref:ATP-dependent sacrificial sulfur transferase LarE n=1 Tax=Selenomonas sp. AE3005 TaxID=1485543 RepID=UPI0025E78B27|nr:ATP-dependent sacrificial sulfur transferase LarE [Selenomonas sp. AE3005]
MMEKELQAKVAKLQLLLKSYGSAAIAFSAGVDSTVLLKAAKEVLGPEQVLALTVQSVLVPAEEVAEAKAFCQAEGLRHTVLTLDPLLYYDVRTNPPERCYFCKRLVFDKMRETAGRENIAHLLDGTNASDGQDYRPGCRALKELRIISPLQEAGMDKADIRAYARELGLAVADKPSAACLASRIPYGEELSAAKLQRIDQAETFLRTEGFVQLRVRSHENIARIELLPADMARFMASGLYEKTVSKFKELGFAYVTLDLQGYRMGSLNETLKGK